jgi:branched-chain amino acid transport system substrate-binding protein
MRERKGKVLVISLAAVLAVLLIFGGLGTSVAKPIKIGGSLPETGIFSEAAKWIKRGYNAWLEDVNNKGGLLGRPVEMIIYDDESAPAKAVTYYERAITVDKVDLISGGYPGTANVAVMPLVEKYGKVFIGMGGHLKSFEQGYTYSFASPPLMSEWVYIPLAGVLDEIISKNQWPKSMAILTMNNVIGLSAKGNVIKSVKERGIKVPVDETYNLPLTDATPLVSKAKGSNADLLVCMSFFDDAVMIMRAAKAMNYQPKMIYQILASTIPAWMKELGEDGNNVLADMFWNPRLPFPGNKKINAAAKRRLGIPVGPTYFGLGYCWMKTLELAVEGTGSLDHKKIRDYLRSNQFDLPYGKGIRFDSRGLPPPYAFMTQTTKGRVELVWPKNVATTELVYPRPAWKK